MSEILIKIYRGSLIENINRGDIAIVNQEGISTHSVGDFNKVTYWRSAAKPIQALPVIYSGAYHKYNFTEPEIAILTSSHNGEEKQIKLIINVLSKINLDEKDLQCGIYLPHKPIDSYLQKEDIHISPIYNPCSGKHAAMLALCQYFGWSIQNYYSIEHPVQQMILEDIAFTTRYPKERINIGVDDCGVPVFGLPIKYMADAYARLANWEVLPKKYREAAQKIFLSIIKHPDIIGGTDRFDTDLMKISNGSLIAKSGADGVFCIGIRNGKDIPGMGIAIKMESGNMKFLPMVVLRILDKLKILSEEKLNQLKRFLPSDIKNYRNEKIGNIVSNFELNKM